MPRKNFAANIIIHSYLDLSRVIASNQTHYDEQNLNMIVSIIIFFF